MKMCVTSVEKIASPIIVHFDGQKIEFANWQELAELEFEKNYLVDRIYDADGIIHIELKENDTLNSTNWGGEEQVGFF